MFDNIAYACSTIINMWHAGFYMVNPQIIRQALEAWATDKVG